MRLVNYPYIRLLRTVVSAHAYYIFYFQRTIHSIRTTAITEFVSFPMDKFSIGYIALQDFNPIRCSYRLLRPFLRKGYGLNSTTCSTEESNLASLSPYLVRMSVSSIETCATPSILCLQGLCRSGCFTTLLITQPLIVFTVSLTGFLNICHWLPVRPLLALNIEFKRECSV